MASLVIYEVAQIQAELAEDWWRENRPRSPNLFITELQHAYALLAEFPAAGAAIRLRRGSELRRFLMSATGYHIYYRYFPAADEVVILSVWSAVKRGRPRLPR